MPIRKSELIECRKSSIDGAGDGGFAVEDLDGGMFLSEGFVESKRKTANEWRDCDPQVRYTTAICPPDRRRNEVLIVDADKAMAKPRLQSEVADIGQMKKGDALSQPQRSSTFASIPPLPLSRLRLYPAFL